VSYDARRSKWQAYRRSKLEKKTAHNGRYDNEKTAAHASDTLVRKLMANGEQGHKLNFPDDDTEVLPEEEINSSHYIGVSYNVKYSKWQAQRYRKLEKKNVCNGNYADEKTAAHASDTLARILMANGEQGHKLNFPDDDIKVLPEQEKNSSQYIGVAYDVRRSKWRAYRYSKLEKKTAHNGSYGIEETAARESDTLARKLMANGEQGHKLNFPDDDTEVIREECQRKRKRPEHEDLGHSKND